VSKAADGRSSIHRRADGVGWEGWVSLGLYPVTVAGKITQLERHRSTGVVTVDPDTTVSACLEAWLAGRVPPVFARTRSPPTAPT
jgi:hypothetical protein